MKKHGTATLSLYSGYYIAFTRQGSWVRFPPRVTFLPPWAKRTGVEEQKERAEKCFDTQKDRKEGLVGLEQREDRRGSTHRITIFSPLMILYGCHLLLSTIKNMWTLLHEPFLHLLTGSQNTHLLLSTGHEPFVYSLGQKDYSRWESNPRPLPCKSNVITTIQRKRCGIVFFLNMNPFAFLSSLLVMCHLRMARPHGLLPGMCSSSSVYSHSLQQHLIRSSRSNRSRGVSDKSGIGHLGCSDTPWLQCEPSVATSEQKYRSHCSRTGGWFGSSNSTPWPTLCNCLCHCRRWTFPIDESLQHRWIVFIFAQKVKDFEAQLVYRYGLSQRQEYCGIRTRTPKISAASADRARDAT